MDNAAQLLSAVINLSAMATTVLSSPVTPIRSEPWGRLSIAFFPNNFINIDTADYPWIKSNYTLCHTNLG